MRLLRHYLTLGGESPARNTTTTTTTTTTTNDNKHNNNNNNKNENNSNNIYTNNHKAMQDLSQIAGDVGLASAVSRARKMA